MALLTNINGKFSVSDAGAVTFNNAFTFPTSDGTLNYFLQTNGSGQLAWAAGPTGTVKGTGAATRVAFWSANDTISSSADLYWDNTNKRLGIGVAAPAALLEINGTGDAIRVESENTGAGGAQVDLLHFSPSPADNDTMGYINMGGYYSGTNSAYFSSIRTVATDISAREGEIQFWTVDTTLKQRMVIDKNGNVGIGNEGTGVALTGKGLGIQNIGQDTTASMRLTGHNATGNPGVATYTELKHYGEFLSFGINHNGGTDVMTISPSKQVTFSGLVSGVTPTAAANFATKAYVDAHPGGTVTGTGAASRVAYWTTASNISYNDDFKYDGFRKIALGGDIETSLSDFCSIEIGNVGMLMSEKADSQYNSMFLSANAYYTTAWKYKTATVTGASYVSLYQGGLYFGTAPAPSAAGDNITWNNRLIIANDGVSTFYKSIYLSGANNRFYANGGGGTNWRGVEVSSSGIWSWGETGIGNYFSKDISIGVTSFDHEINIHKAQAQGPIISLKETTTLNGSAEGGPCNDLGRIQWQSADTSTSQGGLVRGVIRVRPGECAYGTGGVIDIGTLDTYTGASTSAWQVRMQIESNGLVRHKFSTELGTTANAVTNQFTTLVAGYGVLNGNGDGNRYGSYGWINFNSNTNYTGGSRPFAITNAFKATSFAIMRGTSNQAPPTIGDGGSMSNGNADFVIAGNDGDVGIGVDVPLRGLHVARDAYITGSVGIGENNLQRKFNLYDGTDTWTRVQCGASTADWLHGIAGSDHTYKWYNQSSNGGVGYKMGLATSGALTVSSDVVAYGSPSDKRLKENIKPIESALDKAMKLQGVTFDWKKSDSILKIKEDIGFIAQDVQKVIPELVRENDNGMLSMRHQGIAPILLEAIKELKAEIEELKLNNCNCK